MRTLKGVDIEIDEDRMELHILKNTRDHEYSKKRHHQLVKLGSKDAAGAVVKAMMLMEARHA